MASPHFSRVVDQLQIHDRAIEAWLRTAPLGHEDRPVPVVFAPPDRAFAAMQRLLAKTLGQAKAEQTTNVPLPFLSISRQGVKFDPQRFHGQNNYFRKIATASDGKRTANLRWPYPISITYQVEVWAKNRSVLNVYEAWVLGSFEAHEMFLAADWTSLWPEFGTKLLPCETLGVGDTSEIEPGEGERILRFTQSLLVKGWLVGQLRAVPTVLAVDADIFVALNSGEDLSAVEIADLDDTDRFQAS